MKTIYIFIFSLFISASSFAQYYVYTATKTGSWNDMSVWSIVPRTDGVPKMKVVIPAPYIISVDNAVNSFGLGDVEINITGSISIQPSTTIALSSASVINILGSGSVIGTNNTQKITEGGIVKYDGSLDHTKTGAGSFANSSTGVSPAGFTLSLLPVVFTGFTVIKNGNDIVLKWSTASEIANSYFEIERSYNGNAWTAVSTITANGSATTSANYSYTDNNITNAVVYYRLKQVDMDGAFLYSTIKTIRNGNTAAAKIYGTGKTINIELNAAIKNNVMVTVMNTSGQVMERKQFSAGYKITFDVNNAAADILIVHVSDNDALNQTAKLVL
ncbi:MAG: hypothetical protein ABJB86_24010 [Bacteroidota bacterium]